MISRSLLVDHYTSTGMDEDELHEARESIANLINDYE